MSGAQCAGPDCPREDPRPLRVAGLKPSLDSLSEVVPADLIALRDTHQEGFVRLVDECPEKILQGEFPDGSTIKVLAGSDRLNFKRGAGSEREAA